MPFIHQSIIETGHLLGYSKSIPKGGVCYGLTLKWLEACLIGEEERFIQRIKTIMNDKHLVENITRIKEKIKQHEQASQEENDYLEILGFYESLSLIHHSYNYLEIFDRSLVCEYELGSQVAGSDKMRELGGIVCVYKNVGIYTTEDIENYLNQLATKIDDSNVDSGNPIGFLLCDAHHAIGLTYHKSTHQWRLKDNGDDSSLLGQSILTTKEISEKIFSIYQFSDPRIELQFDELEKALKASWITSIENSFTYNKKTVSGRYQKSPEIWMVDDHQFITKEDAKQYVYKVLYGRTPLSPIVFSTEIITTAHHEKIFQLKNQWASCKKSLMQDTLAMHDTDFNATTKIGQTPLMCAVSSRQYDVVHWLLKQGVDLDAKTLRGETAVRFAAFHGDIKMIHLLAEHGANLNISTFGATPLFIAAQIGHAEVVQFLVERSSSKSIPFISSIASLRQFAETPVKMLYDA